MITTGWGLGRRHGRRVRASLRGDGGSTTVEIALAVPVAVALLLLMIASGRYATALIDVQSTAGAAARAASLARSPAAAYTAASQHTDTLTGCTRRADTVDTSAFRPGGQVGVTVTCTITTRAVTGFGLPGEITLTGTSSSLLDLYRTVTVDP